MTCYIRASSCTQCSYTVLVIYCASKLHWNTWDFDAQLMTHTVHQMIKAHVADVYVHHIRCRQNGIVLSRFDTMTSRTCSRYSALRHRDTLSCRLERHSLASLYPAVYLQCEWPLDLWRHRNRSSVAPCLHDLIQNDGLFLDVDLHVHVQGTFNMTRASGTSWCVRNRPW